MTEIRTAAFADCNFLESVTFPSNTTKIGRYAFRCCSSLKSISIPSTVTEIDYGAFMGCTSLTTIEIPPSVKIIHRYAFSHCSSLVAVTFHTSSNTPLQIFAAAFNNCKSLISIAIPQNATFVIPPDGYDARNPPPFGSCSKLERIWSGRILSSFDKMNTWLEDRYNDLPLHQICCNANVSLDMIETHIKNNPKMPMIETCDSRF